MEKQDFDFSKPEDRNTFNELSQDNKDIFIANAQDEALTIQKVKKSAGDPPKTYGNIEGHNLSAELQRPDMTIWSIEQLHELYKPEVIFLTQTGSTLYGWAIKEIYKEAWPEENVPKILTINVNPMKYRNGSSGESDANPDEPGRLKIDENGQEFLAIQQDVMDKLKNFKITGNIAVIDEARGFTIKLTRRDILGNGGVGHPVFEPSATSLKSEPGYYDSAGGGSLGGAYTIIKTAAHKLGLSAKVACLGLGGLERETGGPWIRKGEGGLVYEKVKGEDERKSSQKRIEELKAWGRSVGKAIAEQSRKV